MALGFWKGFEFVEHGLELLLFVEGLVGGDGGGDERVGEELVHLVGADAAAAVESEVPCDADEPDAEVADVGQGLLVLEDADEGVLNDVFGFSAVA